MRARIDSVVQLRQSLQFAAERRRINFDAAAVARLDPAFIADEPDGTRAEVIVPAGPIAEWRVEEAHHELHAIGIMGRNVRV